MKELKWLGSTICDVCKTDLHSVKWFADCRTIPAPPFGGRWALLCSRCHKRYAMSEKFGTGIGQKYDGVTFNKIA